MKYLLAFSFLFASQLSMTQGLDQFFDDANDFLSTYVDNEGKVNYSEVTKNDNFKKITNTIATIDISNATIVEQKAFYINAYNLMAIKNVVDQYPITSVRKIRGFFKSPITIAGSDTSLDKLEQSMMPSTDPRLHMILVCAANSCPQLQNTAFFPKDLDIQIDKAVENSLLRNHIVNNKNEASKLDVSKIFDWYKDDFEKEGGIISFINKHSSYQIASNRAFNYMPYDWSLNDGTFFISKETVEQKKKETIIKQEYEKEKHSRYIVSSLYDKGVYDFHFFNNGYIETIRDNATDVFKTKSVFLTNYLQLVYGINKRFNIGLDLKIRSVTHTLQEDDAVSNVLKYNNNGASFASDGSYAGYNKAGITAIGLKVKYLPFSSISRLSIQSTLYIPVIGKSENDNGYIDWTSPTWNTQLFYDHDINKKVSLFTEVDLIIENMDGSILGQSEGYNQVSTPMTMILSYFPTHKSTIYILLNSTPKWNNVVNNKKHLNSAYDPYSQYGFGLKYYISKKVQIEFIYTRFHSTNVEKTADTYNFGARYFGY